MKNYYSITAEKWKNIQKKYGGFVWRSKFEILLITTNLLSPGW